MSKWISVKDRLPMPKELPVLAFASGYPNAFSEHNGIKIVYGLDRSYSWGTRITHWMPLPDAPKEQP